MIAIMWRDLGMLWRGGRRIDVQSRETLFRAGDRVQLLYRVEKGAVTLTRPLAHGAVLTLQVARPGDLLAEASLFAAVYHCDAVAVCATRLTAVPVESVLAAMRQDPRLLVEMARHLSSELQHARARAEIIAMKTVAQRLDAWLALNDGLLPDRGTWRDLSQELGVSPEALYRDLAKRRSR